MRRNSKKLLAVLLTVVMMLTMAVPVAFASGVDTDGPVWSVEFDKSAKAVVITVNDETQKFTNWKNNQAEEYTVNGWIISVTVKGNAIDKKALIGPAAAPATPIEEVAVANVSTPSNSQIVVDAETRIWQDGFGFHCNAAGGNGATSVINLRDGKTVNKGDQKDVFGTKSFPVTLERVGATTLWNLMTDEIECATCSSKEWVTYSNNSGVINGKNIQAHHPAYVQIAKTWTDENPNGLEAIFDIYKYDAKKDDGRGELVVEGALPDVKYQLEPGTYVVAERVKEGYKVQPDQRLTVEEGKATVFSFKNEPNDVEKYGGLSIQKTVNDVPFYQWASDNKLTDEQKWEIIGGMEFTAYLLTGENGDRTSTSYSGEIDANGLIDFGKDLSIGWYEIEEKVSGTSLTYFVGEGESKIVYVGEGGVSHETANIISGIDGVGTIVSHDGTGVNWPLPKVWNDRLANEPYFQELLDMGAQWIWDTEDTYQYGFTGSVAKFDFTVGVEEDTTAPIIFAADNAAVIYVNGELAAKTEVAFADRDILQMVAEDVTAETFFDSLNFDQFDGRWNEGWAHVYKEDITLTAGKNTITIFAANSESTNPEYTGNPATGTDNDSYDLTNNPCGVIFGFQLPGVTFDNAAIQKFTTVSFTKEAVGDDVDLTQFAFDLFKYNEETKDYDIRIPYVELDVDTNEPLEGDGYYYADDSGAVIAGHLEIGKYVFKEVDNDLWAPRGYEDGLFFEIAREDSELVVTWEVVVEEDVDGNGNPIVVNKRIRGDLEVTAAVTAQHEKVTYEPEYEYLTDSNTTKTLTLRGEFGDNNINYVKLPAEDFYADGYTGEVAVSFNNSGKDPGTGIFFTVAPDGSVSFSVDVFKSDYSVLLYDGPNFQNKDNKHDNKFYNFTTGGEYVYLYFHNQGGLEWYTGEKKVVGYTEISRETITDTYSGTLTVTLKDAGGKVVDTKTIANNGSVTFENHLPGEYTCVFRGDDFEDQEETVTIVAEETASVSFTVTVINPIEEVGKTPKIGTIIPAPTATQSAPRAAVFYFVLIDENIEQSVPFAASVPNAVEEEEPVTEEPATEEPITEEPITEEPATEEPVTEEPVTEEPVTEVE